jgi:hypothetical protein
MNEDKIRKIVREEIADNNIRLESNIDSKLSKLEFKIDSKLDAKFAVFKSEILSEFDRHTGMLKEEFVSQMSIITEYTQHVDENLRMLSMTVGSHELRLNKAGI